LCKPHRFASAVATHQALPKKFEASTDMALISAKDKPSLNARVSAAALVVGTLSLLILASVDNSLAPLRLLTLGVLTFGAWAFCDEMGMRKPLIRAGFVAFIFAIFARSYTLMEPYSDSVGRFLLLYTFSLMTAMLIWSVAYLHRQRDLKYAGALGALASLAPIAALILGHIALGAGAVFGFGSLLASAQGGELDDLSGINTIDFMFGLWSLVTAWFLWHGHIKSTA
jgi:hypothetical protein